MKLTVRVAFFLGVLVLAAPIGACGKSGGGGGGPSVAPSPESPPPPPEPPPEPTPPSPATPLPPSTGWPTRVELAVGESAEYTLQDGTTRTLQLVSYEIVIPRQKVRATVEVSGASQTTTHTLEVAFAGVPAAINGLWVYAFVWKEANVSGFELAGVQGSFPLTDGKDVGFAVNDARYPLYPDMDSYTYHLDVAFHEGHDFIGWLAPDGWAHSGNDLGVHDTVQVLAIHDGTVWYSLDGDPSSQGQVWVSTTDGSEWGDPRTWFFTHVRGGTATVPSGTFVTKGTPLGLHFHNADSPYHFHMGSRNTFDFGPWIFAASVWNHEHRDDFPTPRYWLMLGPYPGGMSDDHIQAGENGNLAATVQPKKGAPDMSGNESWRFGDNFANSVVRFAEMASIAPWAESSDADITDAVGYACTYIHSSADHSSFVPQFEASIILPR